MRSIRLIALAAVLLIVFCSCGTKSTSNATSGMIKADAMDSPYGNNVSDSLEKVLKNSGEVVVYSVGEQLSERDTDFVEYFEKYYNGEVVFEYCPSEDMLSKIITDNAAGLAPDVVNLSQYNWPNTATKKFVYSINQLEQQGIEGLTHPELMRYRTLTEDNFSYNGECYSISVSSCVPIIAAINIDLFDRCGVQSPLTYNADGSWNFDTFFACCSGIIRGTAGNNRIKSLYASDMGWFMTANDAAFVSIDGPLKSQITSDNSKSTLTYLRQLYETNSISADANSFKKGETAIYLCAADEFIGMVDKLKFKWDVVPFPYGNKNVSGYTPGRVTGYSVSVNSENPQGAVNYIIARNMFDNFYLHNKNGAVWKKEYIVYSTEQLNTVINSIWRTRNCLFRGVGDLSDEYSRFWSDFSNENVPIDTLVYSYDDIIKYNCR